jgi:hypothetical protein
MAMTSVMEATVFTTEETNVADVYFKLAKSMFRVKLTLRVERESVRSYFSVMSDNFVQAILYSPSFLKLKLVHAHTLNLSYAYPRSDSTKISMNSMNAILGRNFLREKKNRHKNMIKNKASERTMHDLDRGTELTSHGSRRTARAERRRADLMWTKAQLLLHARHALAAVLFRSLICRAYGGTKASATERTVTKLKWIPKTALLFGKS